MEWISGFDARPYMSEASWGEPKYKSLSGDPHEDGTSGKLSMGDGCKIHPAKKNRFKLQGESDPANKSGSPEFKSTRAAVAVIRPLGSTFIPVIEESAKVVSTDPEGLVELPKETTFGAPDRDNLRVRYGNYWSQMKEWEASKHKGHYDNACAKVRAHNDALRAEHERNRLNTVPTDTAAFAYKRFRLEAADLLEHAKAEHATAKEFYKDHPYEIQEHALTAAGATAGVTLQDLVSYIRAAGFDELADVVEDPTAYREKVKKAALTRKQRAKRGDVTNMTDAELEAAKDKRLAAYLEVVEEINKRQDVNGWRDNPEPDPEPDPDGAPIPEEMSTVESMDTVEQITPVPATRAEKRAAARAAKLARKAQRRRTRRMLRREKVA